MTEDEIWGKIYFIRKRGVTATRKLKAADTKQKAAANQVRKLRVELVELLALLREMNKSTEK